MVIVNEKDLPPPYAPLDANTDQLPKPSARPARPNTQGLTIQSHLAALHAHQRHRVSRSVSPSGSRTPYVPVPPYAQYASLTSLPPSIMLRIVYACFPAPDSDPTFERLRRTLFWLAASLRATNRGFFVACMQVLRSSYFPAHAAQVRRPYTSNPIPAQTDDDDDDRSLGLGPAGGAGPEQRETAVLDKWLLLKVREDVLADESELHLDLDPSRDVFDIFQPRARLEDLVREYGVQQGVISLAPLPQSSSPQPPPSPRHAPIALSVTPPGSAALLHPSLLHQRRPSQTSITLPSPGVYPFHALNIAFETRRAGLYLSTGGGRKRVLVELARLRDDTLEHTATRIVQQLVYMRRSGEVYAV